MAQGIVRVPTGIPGFDELVQGGFPRGSAILLTGAPGTGKSIFGLQFIYNGATQLGESGLYVTFGQPPEELRQQARQFGWEFEPLEKISKANFFVVPVDLPRLDVFDCIKEAQEKVGAERVVVDSLSIFGVNAEMYSLPLAVKLEEQERQYREAKGRHSSSPISGASQGRRERLAYLFVRKIKALGATALFISDAPPQGSQYWSRDTVSEFACDGVVKLDSMLVGTTPMRLLTAHKMRHTAVDISPRAYTITSGRGIIVEQTKD